VNSDASYVNSSIILCIIKGIKLSYSRQYGGYIHYPPIPYVIFFMWWVRSNKSISSFLELKHKENYENVMLIIYMTKLQYVSKFCKVKFTF